MSASGPSGPLVLRGVAEFKIFLGIPNLFFQGGVENLADSIV